MIQLIPVEPFTVLIEDISLYYHSVSKSDSLKDPLQPPTCSSHYHKHHWLESEMNIVYCSRDVEFQRFIYTVYMNIVYCSRDVESTSSYIVEGVANERLSIMLHSLHFRNLLVMQSCKL